MDGLDVLNTNTFSEVESVNDRYVIISNSECQAIIPSLYNPDKEKC